MVVGVGRVLPAAASACALSVGGTLSVHDSRVGYILRADF